MWLGGGGVDMQNAYVKDLNAYPPIDGFWNIF